MVYRNRPARIASAVARALVGSMLLYQTALAQPAAPEVPRRVPAGDIEAIMRSEALKGYDLKATSNAVRLLAAVIFGVSRSAAAERPSGEPLLLGHDEYFAAYIAAAGVTAEQAPTFARVAHDHAEDQIIEYRRTHVIRDAGKTSPDFAVTVCGGWAAAKPERYSFDDITTSPHIRSIHERVNSYRLLDVSGVIVNDEIQGIGGRPISGVLGAVFKVLGDARAIESRTGFATDGMQVSRATGRKGLITKTQAVTVSPNGQAVAGVPDGRPDLVALDRSLQFPLNATYVPFTCKPGESLTSRP